MSTSHSHHAKAHIAWRQLLTAHARLVREIAEGMDAAGVLSMERYDLLLVLAESPEKSCRLTDLADAMLFTRGGITRLVSKLRAEGLVKVQASPDDARVKYATLTAKGERALASTWRVYGPLIDRLFVDRLDAQSVEGLQKALSRVVGGEQGVARVPLTVKGEAAGDRGLRAR